MNDNSNQYVPSSAVDLLATGVTTLRDDNGVVIVDRLLGLTEDDKTFLVGSGEYSRDELFPHTICRCDDELSRPGRWIFGDGSWVAGTTGGDWRYFTELGLPVRGALAAVVYGRLCKAIERLPAHLRHAIARQPAAIVDAAERARRELTSAGGAADVPADAT